MSRNKDVSRGTVRQVFDGLTVISVASHAAHSNCGGLIYYPVRTLEVDSYAVQSAGKKCYSETKDQLSSQLALLMSDYHDVYSCLKKLNDRKVNKMIANLSSAEDYLTEIQKVTFWNWKEARGIGRKAIAKRLSLCRPELRQHLPQDKIKVLISQQDFNTIIAHLSFWLSCARILTNALQVCDAQDRGVVQVDKKIRRKVREWTSFAGEKFAAMVQYLLTSEVDKYQQVYNPDDSSHRTSFDDKMMVALVAHVPAKNIWHDTTELWTFPDTAEFFDALIVLGKLHSGQSVCVPANVARRLLIEVSNVNSDAEADGGDIRNGRKLLSGYLDALVDHTEIKATWAALENGATEVVIRPRLDVIDQRILS